MDTRSLFLALCPTGTRKRYVAPTGNDTTGTGAQGAPYATIGRATADAVAGDQILVSSGTYGYTRIDSRRGTPWRWITIMPATPADVVKVHVDPTNTGNYENVGIISSTFVGLYGIEVYGGGLLGVDDANSDRSAIAIYGGSHHVRVWSCTLHDVPGGGINCFYTGGSFDMLDLCFNTIYGTSRRSVSNTSGISINNGQDITGGATWPGGHAIRCVGNHIYDVVCTVPFTPGGYNIVTDGNGISLDLMLDTYGYSKPILCEANIIHGCGARAIHSYGCINVDMLHNTVWGNLQDKTGSSAIAGDPELDSEQGYAVTQTAGQAASNLIYGNIIAPTVNGKWADTRSTYQNNVVVVGGQAVTGTNIDRKVVGLNYAPALTGNPSLAGTGDGFRPVTADQVPRHPRATNWSALGVSARTGVGTWAAGALD